MYWVLYVLRALYVVRELYELRVQYVLRGMKALTPVLDENWCDLAFPLLPENVGILKISMTPSPYCLEMLATTEEFVKLPNLFIIIRVVTLWLCNSLCDCSCWCSSMYRTKTCSWGFIKLISRAVSSSTRPLTVRQKRIWLNGSG